MQFPEVDRLSFTFLRIPHVLHVPNDLDCMGIVVKSAQIVKLKVFEIDVPCTVSKKIL
jgi:hypothetical protein